MTTSYASTDTLPKDSGGQKFLAVINDAASSNSFSLLRGIGGEGIGSGSFILSHMAIATHTVGSKLHTPGVLLLGAYTEAPSAIGQGNAQRIRTDKEGALYTRGASALYNTTTASTNIHVSGSALLHGYSVYISDATPGNKVVFEDGDNYLLTVYIPAGAASKAEVMSFNQGIFCATNVKSTTTITGAGAAASVTAFYSRY